MQRLAASILAAACALAGCDRLRALTDPKPAEAAAPVSASAGASGKEPAAAASAAAPAAHGEQGPSNALNFPVPFAWETSHDEPLAQARLFVQEMLVDNRAYMTRGAPFFAAFADQQKPRATVVTCSDSRVQSGAYDGTPENDAFTIRNIGNQVGNAQGSVEYGVEHLGTPVLMVLGHTGCGAVKAAMGDLSKQSAAVQHELEHLEVPKPKPGTSDGVAWVDAVIANVNTQVAGALQHFGGRVQAGKLTVVGAVYDFRNDLGRGAGRISVVNVNGNAEPGRMQAFISAVELPVPAKSSAGRSSASSRAADSASSRIQQELLETLKAAAQLDKPAAPARPRAGDAPPPPNNNPH